MKFAWIQAEKAHYPVRKLCRWLAVTPSGFYAWCQRPASARTKRDRHLRVLVQASFDTSKRRYGSPRIHEDLLEQDERVSRKRVIRLMQAEGLKARVRKRFKGTTMSDHDLPVAANLLNRQFTAEAPNQRWVGDTTEFVIGESSKLYLAAILDLLLAVHRRVGGQCGQRPASDHQGPRDGPEAALSRMNVCPTSVTAIVISDSDRTSILMSFM